MTSRYIYIRCLSVSYYISSIEKEVVFSSSQFWVLCSPNCQTANQNVELKKTHKLPIEPILDQLYSRIHLAYWRQYISQWDKQHLIDIKLRKNSRRNVARAQRKRNAKMFIRFYKQNPSLTKSTRNKCWLNFLHTFVALLLLLGNTLFL